MVGIDITVNHFARIIVLIPCRNFPCSQVVTYSHHLLTANQSVDQNLVDAN